MIRFPNRTAQTAVFHTGTPDYVDLTGGAAITGMVDFAARITADSWMDGDLVGILVRKSDTDYQVWTAQWDETGSTLQADTVEMDVGTLTDEDVVTVSAVMTTGALAVWQAEILAAP